MSRIRTISRQRGLAVTRTLTSVRVTVAGDLPVGQESAMCIERYGYWTARANVHGDTCSGTGDTREEALAAARRRCDEHRTWKLEKGLA